MGKISENKYFKKGLYLLGALIFVGGAIGSIQAYPDFFQNTFDFFTTPEDGVYDNMYKSYSGGFYVSKPNVSWQFVSLEDLGKTQNKQIVSDALIDGIALENPSSVDTIMIRSLIPNEKELNNLGLEVFLKNKIILKESDVIEPIIQRIDKDNRWVESEFDSIIKGELAHSKFRVELKNEKLFIIQSVLWDPDVTSDKFRNDMDFVWDSFNYCLDEKNCND